MDEEQQKSIAAAHPEVEASPAQDAVHENVQDHAEDAPKPKVKRQMTEKQKAALNAAREKRTARLREMSKQKAEEDEKKRLEEAKRLLEEEKAKKKAARLAKAAAKNPVKETKLKEPTPKKKPVKAKAPVEPEEEHSPPNIKIQPTNPIASRLYDQQAEVAFNNPYDVIFGNTYRRKPFKMSINNQTSGSTYPVVPQNWIYASRQFEMNSDALSENIMIYRGIKDSHDSRASGSPIKVVIDSPSSFLRPQRTYMSCRITHYNADGTPNTNITASEIGLMSHFKTATLRVSGKIAEEYSDYPEHVGQQYTYETAARRKYLRLLEGAGNANAIKNDDGSAVVRHHLRFGLLNNINGNPLPLCLLPNQAVELTLTLNTPQQAVTNAPAGGYFIVDDFRIVAQLVTPSAEFLSSAWAGIRNGKYLELDYVAGVQTVNNCSGASQNNFIIPLSNSRVVGLMHRFRKNDAYTATTGDKSLIYDKANLVSWRYQLGQWRLPLTEDFKVEDALINGALSMSDSENYEAEDVDFDNFDSKRFTIRHNFQSIDEGMSSALNLTGSDGNLKLITTHSSPPPPTSTVLLTTVFVHRTLLIGNTIDTV